MKEMTEGADQSAGGARAKAHFWVGLFQGAEAPC
jgi:hypothetical protein